MSPHYQRADFLDKACIDHSRPAKEHSLSIHHEKACGKKRGMCPAEFFVLGLRR